VILIVSFVSKITTQTNIIRRQSVGFEVKDSSNWFPN